MNTINKCLFPVAGYGTRFLPATKAIPKEVLPIITKPLIQYGVEEAMSTGMIIQLTNNLNNRSRQY
jgi:UTP--glucose-1-phosphate uridylyltransferase